MPALCSGQQLIERNESGQWDLVRTVGWVASQRAVTHQQARKLGNGIFVCYSGTLRDGCCAGLLERQLALITSLRRTPTAGRISIGLSLAGNDTLDSALLLELKSRPGVERVLAEKRAENSRYAHPQYHGIVHCGQMARRFEQQRGRPFGYALRTRYDLLLVANALSSLPRWPIWDASTPASALAYGKRNRCEQMRCLPSDVFFVARLEQKLAGCRAPPSVACAFEGQYARLTLMDATGDWRDSFEATLFWPWLGSALPMYVLWGRDRVSRLWEYSWLFHQPTGVAK